jgi:DNA-binding NarL/FixJ family response regulator
VASGGNTNGALLLRRAEVSWGQTELPERRSRLDDGRASVQPATLTVVLADSQPVVRDGMRALLAGVGGIEVVAEAGTGRDAVRESMQYRPDVLILDLRMADQGGAATIREVRRAVPGTAVLVFTQADDDESVFSAMRAGARGYLLKRAERDDIVRAIKGVAAGGAVFGSPIAERLVELFGPGGGNRAPFPELTGREREVLDLLAAGLPNSAIARRLSLASKTVSNHLSAIFAKLQVSSRAAAIVLARQAGLGRASA